MSYRNKTYVIFDGDEDIWAYGFMLGWKTKDHLDFNFHNAHDLNTITERANEDSVKRKLRARFADTKQVIVLIGDNTKNLYRFVRWEIDTALELGLPIIAVNLNNDQRFIDTVRCPPILKGKDAIHVPFKLKIIKYAMDNFPSSTSFQASEGKDWRYKDQVYTDLGL